MEKEKKLKCMFYGNCQMKEFAKIFSKIQTRYDVLEIATVHKLTSIQLDTVYQLLPELDLLVIQPISDRYKNNSRLSTKSILEKVSLKCKVIMIPVCYFTFYYPSICCLKAYDKKYSEYFHDTNFLQLYRTVQEKDIILNQYGQIIDDINYYSSDFYLNMAEKSISELYRRQTELESKYHREYIDVATFIRDNYKKNLLFYTINHPTQILIIYIIVELVKKLNLEEECADLDLTKFEDDPFHNKRAVLYSSLQKVVNFDVKQYTPILFGKKGVVELVKEWTSLLESNLFRL